jgi:hypothetical protein
MNIKFKNKWYDITMDELEELADQIDQIYGIPYCDEVIATEIPEDDYEDMIRIEKIKTTGERISRDDKCGIN